MAQVPGRRAQTTPSGCPLWGPVLRGLESRSKRATNVLYHPSPGMQAPVGSERFEGRDRAGAEARARSVAGLPPTGTGRAALRARRAGRGPGVRAPSACARRCALGRVRIAPVRARAVCGGGSGFPDGHGWPPLRGRDVRGEPPGRAGLPGTPRRARIPGRNVRGEPPGRVGGCGDRPCRRAPERTAGRTPGVWERKGEARAARPGRPAAAPRWCGRGRPPVWRRRC
jgi:hypothetical protein